MQEIAAIAFTDLFDVANDDGSLKPLSEISKVAVKAISEVEVIDRGNDGVVNRKAKAKLHDKLAALRLLAQFTGLTTDIKQAIKCLDS